MKLFTILLFSFLQINQYDFAEVYKNDIENLKADEHNNGAINSKINVFQKFTSISISKYKIVKRNKLSAFNLIEWYSKKENISSIKRVTKCVKTPNGLFINFVAYKFINKQNTYYYISVESQGLMEYSINKKDFNILYESTILGLDDVYFETKTELKKALD